MPARYLTALPVLISVWGCAGPREVAFKMHVINADSPYEGAGVLDVNRDGKLDIFSGGFWYEAPTWKKHFVRQVEAFNNYHDDFCNLPVDVDGDGWVDIITATWRSKRISWLRNPGQSDDRFTEIIVDEQRPGNMETAILADVNADGQPDVVPNVYQDGQPAWYEFHRDPTSEHGVSWERHVLPCELAGAGVGAGDVNGDGRCDIVGGKGWAEQPVEPAAAWTWHPEFDLVDAGIPILIHDVDTDGDADLIWGIGHNYGLYWLEQHRNATGKRVWSKHEIDRQWSQAHVVMLGDLDGDGRKELVTGKRYFAHNGNDSGGRESRCLYYYDFDPKMREWRRHTIHEGGSAGTGTSAEITDIDADGDLDLILPGKSGLYLFENLRK